MDQCEKDKQIKTGQKNINDNSFKLLQEYNGIFESLCIDFAVNNSNKFSYLVSEKDIQLTNFFNYKP